MGVKGEVKSLLEMLINNLNSIVRFWFSGIVAILVFEIGTSGATTWSELTQVTQLEGQNDVCDSARADF